MHCIVTYATGVY